MALSCTIVAGLLCFHVAHGPEPVVDRHADATYARGKGWAISEFFRADRPAGFDSLKINRARVGQDCISYRRICDLTNGQAWCNYFMEGDRQQIIELYAKNRKALREAARDIGVYMPGRNGPSERQSDFPLALLDQAAQARSK